MCEVYPKITLYEFHPSYFSQMARLSLVENGIPFTRKPIDILKCENYAPDYVKINPACEVPAMAFDDKVINGSQAIMDTIAQWKGKAPNPKAEELRKRCFELPINELAGGLLYHPDIVPGLGQLPPMIKGAYEALLNRPTQIKEMIQKHPEHKAAYEDKMKRTEKTGHAASDIGSAKKALQTVESFLDDVDKQLAGQKEWLFGSDFTSADVMVAVLLGRLELLGISDKLFNDSHRKNVAEYYRRLKERPSFKKECVTSFG